MQPLAHRTLWQTLQENHLALRSPPICIEDRERRCRWIRLLEDGRRVGLPLEPAAMGRTIRLRHAGAVYLELTQGPAESDLVLGYDVLRSFTRRPGSGPESAGVVWRLKALQPLSPPPAVLGDRAGAIANASTGAWIDAVTSAALAVREVVRDRRSPAYVVVHRISTAADGWTVRRGLDAVVQVGVWEVVTAAFEREAAARADALRTRLAGAG